MREERNNLPYQFMNYVYLFPRYFEVSTIIKTFTLDSSVGVYGCVLCICECDKIGNHCIYINHSHAKCVTTSIKSPSKQDNFDTFVVQ